MKQLSIIAILISFSAMLPAQEVIQEKPVAPIPKDFTVDGSIPDTITISAQHQKILPELIRQQAELEKAIRDVNEKLMILLTAYIDDPDKLKNGNVQFTQDMKKIIVK